MLDRYLFSRLLKGQIALTLVLTAVIWLVQALNLFDKSLTSGASPLETMAMSLLVLPRVLTFTLGPALLITVLSQMVRLLQEYEYFALTAAGLSPLRILRPIAALALLTMLLQAALSFYLSPIALKQLKISSDAQGAKLVLAELQAGAFKNLTSDITAYTSGRDNRGKWQDVMIHDASKQSPTTYTARSAILQSNDGESFFFLEDGTQQIIAADGSTQLVRFREYVLPLQSKKAAAPRAALNRNHMMIHQLLNPAAHGVTHDHRIRRMKARGLELVANTTAPFIFMLISFAVVTGGGINRHGYGRRIMLAIGLALFYQIGIIALASTAVDENQPLIVFVWPVVFFLSLFAFILMSNNPALLSALRRTKTAPEGVVEGRGDA